MTPILPMIPRLAAAVAAILLFAPFVSPALDLVRDGKPSASIVIPDKPTQLEREAAQKLVQYLKLASGAELPVVPESQKPAGTLISLGKTRLAASAGVSDDKLVFDGYRLLVKNGTLFLLGRDQEIMKAPPGQGDRIGAQGSIRAALGLLECLGFRWLQPTDRGVHVPPLKTVSVPDTLNVTHQPPFMYVAGRMYTLGDWSLANSFRKAARLFSTGGHTWDPAVPVDLWEKHPEYFRMQGGKRIRPTEADHQLCPSNPEVLQRIVDYTLARFAEGFDLVALGQPDGWQPCECEACKKLGWGTTVTDQVHVTQRKVVEAARAKYPDRYVHVIIYGPTRTPPASFKGYPPNLMVELAPPTEENLAFWKNISPGGETVYLYKMGTYLNISILPTFTSAMAWREMAMLLRSGVKGIYWCGGGENWGAEGPTYYTIGRLATDPSQKWENLLDEYCSLTFRKAGKTMRQYYEVLYRRVDLHFAMESTGCSDNVTAMFPPDALDQLGNLLALARSQAEGDKDAQGWIRLAEISFRQCELIAHVYHLHRAYQLGPSAVSLKQVGDAVKVFRGFVDELAALPRTDPEFIKNYFPDSRYWTDSVSDQHGGFANNFGRLQSPFTWDFDALLKSGVLPGASRARAVIARLKSPPVLDGDLSEATWSGAAWFPLRESSLGKTESSARVKLGYDDANMYFAFECDEPQIEEMVVTGYGRDGKVFNTECVEVLLSPDGFGRKRMQFVISPTPEGKWDGRMGFIDDPLHPLVVSGEPDTGWNPNYRHAFKIDKAGKKWTIEMAVPFAEMGVERPAEGQRWRGNFGRERHKWVWNKKYEGQSEFLLWSPNLQGTGFPDPSAFGDLYFGTIPETKPSK